MRHPQRRPGTAGCSVLFYPATLHAAEKLRRLEHLAPEEFKALETLIDDRYRRRWQPACVAVYGNKA